MRAFPEGLPFALREWAGGWVPDTEEGVAGKFPFLLAGGPWVAGEGLLQSLRTLPGAHSRVFGLLSAVQPCRAHVL